MARVSSVAAMLIYLAEHEGKRGLTPLALQKMLYYAQGHHMAKTGKPLFREDFEAWEHGPVVPSIYRKYSKHINQVIPPSEEEPTGLKTDEVDSIIEVVCRYEHYSASELRQMTHVEGAPWSLTYSYGESKVIPQDLIRAYFEESDEAPSMEEITERIVASVSKRGRKGVHAVGNENDWPW